MRRRFGSALAAVCKREEEQFGLSVFGVAATTRLGDTDEAQCLGLADCWCHGIVVDAIGDEILLGHWQAAIVVAAVVCKLDFDARDDAVRG